MYRAGSASYPAAYVMMSGDQSHDEYSVLIAPRGYGEGNSTCGDFELQRAPDGLANLDYSTCSRVVREALHMEAEYRWKGLDKRRDLLARSAQGRMGVG